MVYLYFYIMFDSECIPEILSVFFFEKLKELDVLEIHSFVSWSLFESFESSDERSVCKREVEWSRTKVKLIILFNINCRPFYLNNSIIEFDKFNICIKESNNREIYEK